MALTALEHLALWGPPILALLLTFGYYLHWGKETNDQERTTNSTSTPGGER